ncbi:MAG TPA: hypothetical protein VL125_11395 [Pelobium sp.]|nr:hypothetical protein [Pelobium sp.]
MDKFSKQDVINYADGEMEASTIKSFEEALREDADLRAELKLYQSVKGTLKSNLAPDKADAEFKATLKQFNQQHFKKPKAKIIAFSKIWYAAAVLVIGLLIWAPWNKNLYNQYADTEMISFAERGNNDQADLQNATDAFNERNFEEVKKILNPLVQQDSTNDLLRFYLGVAQLETDSVIIARTNLIKVATKESLLKYDATFYVALSYLKEKNKEQCKVWLHKIPKDAAVYSKAQELLNKL